jgi:DNA polymerase-3 subunit epsilon
MNPGVKVSGFIENYTGISNKMLSTAPAIESVMKELARFIAQHPLVAHNAGFDSRFLDSEFSRVNKKRVQPFACSMLVSRRLYQDAPGHSLETLVHYKKLKTDGVHHRALADAEMTAYLWIEMVNDIKLMHCVHQVSFELMQQLALVPKKKIADYLQKHSLSSLKEILHD